jgi:hypothetical protein
VGKEVHLLFIELMKAYDNIPLIKLWKALEETRLSYTLIKTVKELYRKSLSYVKMGGLLSERFELMKGLRQGCCIAPTLFKICIEKALNIWKRKCCGVGYNVDNTMIYTLQFADDQVMMAQSKEDWNIRMCRKLQEEYSKWGLIMNIAKTKYMYLGTDTNYLEVDNGDIITGCTEYKYLGSICTKDGRDPKNIRHTMTQARKIIGALKGIWWSKDITKNRKKIIYNSMVISVLIYGAETWSLHEDGRKRINVTEMDALRRSVRISKLDRKTNEYIREKMDAPGTKLDNSKATYLVWTYPENGPNAIPKNHD